MKTARGDAPHLGCPLRCSTTLLTSLLLFSKFRFPLLTLTRSPLASGNLQTLISCLYRHLSPQFLLTLFSGLPPLLIPCSKFSLKSCAGPFCLPNKPIQTLGLNRHSHLMASQTSPPVLTLFLNSRAPTQHSQNQSPSFSQTHTACLGLMEWSWWQPRPLLLSPHPGCSVPHPSTVDHSQVGSLLSPPYLHSFFQSISYIMPRVIFLPFSESSPSSL